MSASAEIQVSVEDLLARPWSREVVADEDGVFVASVPELEGCFADGDSVDEALANLDRVLREWLELAVEEGASIPEPRRQAQELYSGRFSVRVPRSLHRELSQRAETEGSSLNQLVAVLLAASIGSDHVEQPQSDRARERQDIHEDIAADAVAGTHTSIGALKGVATFVRDRGDINFACLMFALAADRVAVIEGVEAASHELGMAAALARRQKRMLLAEALWRESLRRHPTNLRSSSSLGQLLHHQGRYREATNYLEAPSRTDNYALLFLGWSLLFEGRESDDLKALQRGRMSIRNALETWSYQNRDVRAREAWLRHVRRLARLGTPWRDDVDGLLSFANSNSGWPKIDSGEIDVGSDALALDDPVHAQAG